MKSGCETKTWDCNLTVIRCCSSQHYSSLQLLSFQEWSLKRHSSSGNNSQRQKMPACNTRQGTVHRFVLLSLQEEETLNPSSKCMMNVWWCHMEQTSKKHFVLECLLISLGFTLLHFCLCHTWPVNVDWAAAYASATFLWETQRLRKICACSCSSRHWFLNLHCSDRLIASDILITFLTIDKLSEERTCFGLEWGPGRS